MATVPRSRCASLNTPGFTMNMTHIPATSTHQDYYVLELSEIDTKHVDIADPEGFCTEEMPEHYRSLFGCIGLAPHE
eukprot:10963010-Prorocentrum_lima.AAC.1